jgi:hypothetical protein
MRYRPLTQLTKPRSFDLGGFFFAAHRTFSGLARLNGAAIGGLAGVISMPLTHIDILTIQPLVALVFGILILLIPRLLNYLIAIYLIIIGVTGLWPHLFTHAV